jgi:hypothetical protein
MGERQVLLPGGLREVAGSASIGEQQRLELEAGGEAGARAAAAELFAGDLPADCAQMELPASCAWRRFILRDGELPTIDLEVPATACSSYRDPLSPSPRDRGKQLLGGCARGLSKLLESHFCLREFFSLTFPHKPLFADADRQSARVSLSMPRKRHGLMLHT